MHLQDRLRIVGRPDLQPLQQLHAAQAAMALMDFIKKQFIDILEWTESGDGTLAWRYPMAGNEIQYGGSLTVRESQVAVFVNEGKVADVFGPGMHKLTTQTLPVLTYLKNWDKLFQSPFKSDVYFFSTRQQIDRAGAPAQPITIRDKDFGAVRLRAFGNYAYRMADPSSSTPRSQRHARPLHRGRPGRPAARPDAAAHQRRGGAPAASPSWTWRPTRWSSPSSSRTPRRAEFAKLGLALEAVTVQNVSLPEELQKILDQKIGMGMVGGDMGKFMQYQTAQAIPKFAKGVAPAVAAAAWPATPWAWVPAWRWAR
jgi:membrane protease subunit (stomatin/prohibitin family)